MRELRSAVEHAVVLAKTESIGFRELPAGMRSAGNAAVDSDSRPWLAHNNLTVQEAEKQLIVRALKEAKGNRTLAAKRIGMSRRTLHRKLHTYQLEGL